MKLQDIEPENVYLAYCGSLTAVGVLETRVPLRAPGQVAATRRGVRVVALYDVPLAEDWPEALKARRKPQLAHHGGDEFVIPARDILRRADLDVLCSEGAGSTH